MYKRNMCISVVVLITLSSLAMADISQSQNINVGISTEPVATNWAVAQLSNDNDASMGTQTQTIVVYTSSNNSNSSLVGNLPASVLFGLGAQSMPILFNNSVLSGWGGSVGLSATGHNVGASSLLSPLSYVTAFSGFSLHNPVTNGINFP